MDLLPMTASQRASDVAGWTLTSLGIITSTAMQEWVLAICSAIAGITILGLNVVLRIRKAIRDEEIAGLRHEIDRLHLKAEEKAEQSREAWARVGAETTKLKGEIEELKSATSNPALKAAASGPA